MSGAAASPRSRKLVGSGAASTAISSPAADDRSISVSCSDWPLYEFTFVVVNFNAIELIAAWIVPRSADELSTAITSGEAPIVVADDPMPTS